MTKGKNDARKKEEDAAELGEIKSEEHWAEETSPGKDACGKNARISEQDHACLARE